MVKVGENFGVASTQRNPSHEDLLKNGGVHPEWGEAMKENIIRDEKSILTQLTSSSHITFWWNALYAIKLLSKCWLALRQRMWICLYYHLEDWVLHSWFIHSASSQEGNGNPFTRIKPLNKINKTHLSIYSARDNFPLYEGKKISLKTPLSSTLLTFQRIYYKHLRSRRNYKVYIALRVAGGKISLPRIYLYTTLQCFFVIV